MPRHPQTERNRAWARLYRAGVTIQRIAQLEGMSESAVALGLLRAGVTLRRPGRPDVRGVPERKIVATPFLPPRASVQDTAERDARRAAEQGSAALAKALWAYGAAHNGLPNIPQKLCERLATG